MFEYLQYLIDKFLGFFGKNREDTSKLKTLLKENKKFLSSIINIQQDYTREELLTILTHETRTLDIYMNKSAEIEELRLEDIEKKTFLDDIIKKIRELDDE